MPITVKEISDIFDKDVFTTKGYYVGKVTDCQLDLTKFKVRSLVVQASRESIIGQTLGGKKGIILPYSMVEAVGDIVIIRHITTPELPKEETESS